MIRDFIIGDTLEKLKHIEDDVIDLSITSPPYNKKAQKGGLVDEVKYKDYIDIVPEEQYQQNQIDVINEVYRITKPGGSFFYNHKLRWDRGNLLHPIDWLRKTEWILKQEIIWNRKIAGNIRGWRFWPIDERIYWLYRPIEDNRIGEELQSRHALLTSIWEIIPEQKNSHPAPFPIDIPARIIFSLLNERNGIVLDPYCGSGTTLLAAHLLDKEYIGIDICKEYLDKSKARITNPSTYDLERFKKEIALHNVIKTYKQRKEAKNKT